MPVVILGLGHVHVPRTGRRRCLGVACPPHVASPLSAWCVALSGGGSRANYALLEGAPGPRDLRCPMEDAGAVAGKTLIWGECEEVGTSREVSGLLFRGSTLKAAEIQRWAVLGDLPSVRDQPDRRRRAGGSVGRIGERCSLSRWDASGRLAGVSLPAHCEAWGDPHGA